MLFESPLVSGKAAGQVALDLLLGRYPASVYGRERPDRQLPPVFGFHSVRAEPFERLLRFLVENEYRTLTCDTYVDWMGGGAPPGQRAVLLGFDDGMGQVWSVAYPLLKKYGLTATVFLMSAMIKDGPDSEHVGPNLDDVWSGNATLEDVETRDESSEPLATWPEIRRMHESGVLDFQAHTTSHNLIFTDSKVRGFVSPELIRGIHPNRLTMWERRRRAYRTEPILGSPIFGTAPRMSEFRQVREDPGLRQACRDHVSNHGGATFFDDPRWRKTLAEIVNQQDGGGAANSKTETEEERRREIYDDLLETKDVLERELRGKSVHHLALPWGVGSDSAVEVAREVGYASVHWGRVDGRLTNFVGGDPFKIARIGEDFLSVLPGTGRSSLADVVRKKVSKNLRRLRG